MLFALKFNASKDDPWQDLWNFKNLSQVQISPFTADLPEVDWSDLAQANCINPLIGANLEDTPLYLLSRQCETFKYDSFKLNFRSVLLPDGHCIFISNDGDYNSLCDRKGMYMGNSKFTSILDIRTKINFPITIQKGPELPNYALSARNMMKDSNDRERKMYP